MSKQPKSAALAAVHEMIEDAFAAGTVGKTTMREFDRMCLTDVRPLSPADIKALRTREPCPEPVEGRRSAPVHPEPVVSEADQRSTTNSRR